MLTLDTRRGLWIYSLLYSLAWILAMKIVDLAPIGPYKTTVGMATMNQWFRNLLHYDAEIGYYKLMFSITKVLAWVALGGCASWIVVGIVQWIKERSFKGVDFTIIATLAVYGIEIITWLVFKLIKINYGPVILPGRPYPNHTFPSLLCMHFICSMGTTIYMIGFFLEERKKLVLILRIPCIIVMAAGFICCTISGINWLSHIIASLLFSVTLLLEYSGFAEI